MTPIGIFAPPELSRLERLSAVHQRRFHLEDPLPVQGVVVDLVEAASNPSIISRFFLTGSGPLHIESQTSPAKTPRRGETDRLSPSSRTAGGGNSSPSIRRKRPSWDAEPTPPRLTSQKRRTWQCWSSPRPRSSR